MDGVLYRGHELIPGADELVRQLRRRDLPFCFLTNNSQRTRRDVVAKLARMGVEVEEEHIFNCAMATARFPVSGLAPTVFPLTRDAQKEVLRAGLGLPVSISRRYPPNG